MSDFDIAIVGGGIAGNALARALGTSNMRIALLEAHQFPDSLPEPSADIDNFDLRVSALTVASQRLLEACCDWQKMAAYRVSPYDQMCVWDAEGTGEIRFDAAEIHQPVLGHIVENRVIVSSLLEGVRQQSNVTLFNPAEVESLEQADQDGELIHVLKLADGRSLSTKLLVGADGAQSRVRTLQGISSREWDYGHTAIVATVRTALPHQRTAWQRFLPQGPLAMLPMYDAQEPDHLCSIVWSCETEVANELIALPDQAFCQRLAECFEHRLGAIESASPRKSFPLRQRHALHYVEPGLALVADAAHTIHPLAGQGINLGLADVVALAEELIRAERRGLSPGDMTVLRRYQRRRMGDNLLMMSAMEGFKRLFGNRALPVRWLRNLGLSRVNALQPLKAKIMKQAMGIQH
jgi:2-octaprenylphenol hydroxylase